MAVLLIVLQVPLVFVVAMAVLMTCYGAGFSLIPPYLSDIFGGKGVGYPSWLYFDCLGDGSLSGANALIRNLRIDKIIPDDLACFYRSLRGSFGHFLPLEKEGGTSSSLMMTI